MISALSNSAPNHNFVMLNKDNHHTYWHCLLVYMALERTHYEIQYKLLTKKFWHFIKDSENVVARSNWLSSLVNEWSYDPPSTADRSLVVTHQLVCYCWQDLGTNAHSTIDHIWQVIVCWCKVALSLMALCEWHWARGGMKIGC